MRRACRDRAGMSKFYTKADFARVMRPLDEFNRTAASGPPLDLGPLPGMTDLNLWPATPAGILVYRPLENARIEKGFLGDHAANFYGLLKETVPEKAIKRIEIIAIDSWHDPDVEEFLMIPHLDGNAHLKGHFTGLATFPNTSYYFPEVPLDKFKDLASYQEFNPGEHKIYRPRPGHGALYNDNKFPHCAPPNTREECAPVIAHYGRPDIMLRDDGHIRRLKIKARMVLQEKWIGGVCKSLADFDFS